MAKGSVYEGKTVDDAVRKGLEELGLSRAEATITVVEEGKGGFLGFGARPFRVSIMRRPGGAVREPEEKTERRVQSSRGRDDRRGGKSRDRDAQGGRDRGRGGREERGEGRKPAEEKPATLRSDAPRAERAERPERGERAERPERGERAERPDRGERRGGRDREAGRDREERRPRPAATAAVPPPVVATPPAAARPAAAAAEGDDAAGDDMRRRRRRGRRGGRGRRRGPEGAREDAALTPNGVAQQAIDHDDDRADEYPGTAAAAVSAVESARPVAPAPIPEAVPALAAPPATAHAPLPVPAAEHAYAVTSSDAPLAAAPARDERYGHQEHHDRSEHRARDERHDSGRDSSHDGPDLSPAELMDTSKRLTGDLLKAMGFEATVSAVAEGNRVDVTAEVAQNDDLLTGQKGEVRQAMQHLLNRFLNRGEGSRYHLQLEINDFWQRRETELEALARSLAEQALATNTEMVTEYLNSQERRIIHVTLKEDGRVRTYALGTGMIKRVAVAPADFPERTGEEDAG